jgi:glutathione S-transferase
MGGVMADIYEVMGSEMSPYSIKVRSYFRYKKIPHRWVQATAESRERYQKYQKLPLVPVVVTPGDEGMQDSTPILEAMEAKFPAPSIHPDDPAMAFISALIEEYGDEWGNKMMFHHRWYYEADQYATPSLLARTMMPDASYQQIAEMAPMIRERMTGRIFFVGSSDSTAPLIEKYYGDMLAILDAHLSERRYLFGARPTFADFGLFAQLYECSVDPTAGGIMRARATNVLDWCYRMIDPKDEGPLESWGNLKGGLEPLLKDIGARFLPWSDANAEALEGAQEEFSVDLEGEAYVQKPQKYHARSLKVLRDRYAAVADKSALDPILEAGDCLRWLA